MSAILVCISFLISYILWDAEYQYTLPTPIPEDFKFVPLESQVSINDLPPSFATKRPYFLHFFSPDCPCSRFNLRHFKNLANRFGDQIHFIVYVPEKTEINKTKSLIDQDLLILEDSEGQIAKKCGVYATPQAVILDECGQIYFRGNFNKARFCTTPGSNYAELSIIRILDGKPAVDWGPMASTAYGCQISEEAALNPFTSPFKYSFHE